MSKVKLTVGKNAPCDKMSSEIEDGTYFTGKIGDYSENAFLKSDGNIVSLQTGKGWTDGLTVKDFVVCDATINLEPVR